MCHKALKNVAGAVPCYYNTDSVFKNHSLNRIPRILLVSSRANRRQPVFAAGFEITCNPFDISVLIDLCWPWTTRPSTKGSRRVRCRCAHVRYLFGQRVVHGLLYFLIYFLTHLTKVLVHFTI